jgi:hypothetical protein
VHLHHGPRSMPAGCVMRVISPMKNGPWSDKIAPASAAAGKHVPLANDPIRPIPIKTVNVKIASPPFGTPVQIEIPEASRDDPAPPQSKAPPQPPFQPQLTRLPHNAGVLGMLLSPEQSARDDIAPPLSATPQSAPPSGRAFQRGLFRLEHSVRSPDLKDFAPTPIRRFRPPDLTDFSMTPN